MYALFVTVKMKPEVREQFIEATLDDARGSVQNEPNCLRFDVLQDLEDPNTVYLYEVYRSEADHLSHREQPHYKKWRETVDDWFAADLARVRTSVIFPPDDAWSK